MTMTPTNLELKICDLLISGKLHGITPKKSKIHSLTKIILSHLFFLPISLYLISTKPVSLYFLVISQISPLLIPIIVKKNLPVSFFFVSFCFHLSLHNVKVSSYFSSGTSNSLNHETFVFHFPKIKNTHSKVKTKQNKIHNI